MADIRAILVDDHSSIREATRAILEMEGDIEVIGEGSNGAEAIELAGALQPDVVISDISMPIMDGVEACRRIKLAYPHIGVILLTMLASQGEEASYAMADGYVLKESPPAELVDAVRRAYLNHLAARALENADPAWRPILHELLLQERLAPELVGEALTATSPETAVGFAMVEAGFITADDLAGAFSRALMMPRAGLDPYPTSKSRLGPSAAGCGSTGLSIRWSEKPRRSSPAARRNSSPCSRSADSETSWWWLCRTRSTYRPSRRSSGRLVSTFRPW